MPRPQTKQDLMLAGNEQFEKLWELIGTMTIEEQMADFDFKSITTGKEAHWERDRNIRDVLIHLYEWHQLLLNWMSSSIEGIEMPFLPEPYNWRTYGKMNIAFWEKHQNTSYEEAQRLLKESHYKVMQLIETFSNTELFTNKYFSWTGNSILGSYCISSTSSHYDWAIKKMNKHKKSFKEIKYKGRQM